MPVLVSSFLLLIVILYMFFVSRWHLFWNVPLLQPFKALITGRLVISHGIAALVALAVIVIAIFAIFRTREQSMVVGNKKTLYSIIMIAAGLFITMAIKMGILLAPLVQRYLTDRAGQL